MASRIAGITIEINGNTTPLTKALKGVNSTISSTQKELRDVNKLLKLDPNNTELLKQKQGLLADAIVATSKKLDEEKKALEQLKKSGNTEETQAQQRALEREIIATDQALGKLVKESEQTKSALTGMGNSADKADKELDGTGKSAKDAGDKAKKSSDGFTVLKGALANLAADAARAAARALKAVGKAAVDAVNDAAEAGDEIDKMSQKLGLSRQAYQEWDFVLSQAGVDINSLQVGMKTMTNKIDDAKNGTESAVSAFDKLGISVSDLNSMSREDAFKAIITSMQGMEDSTERAALANDLFGKSGQNLTPLLNESAESTQELIDKANKLGMIMSDEAVDAAVKYQDQLEGLKHTFEAVKNGIMSNLLPGITEAMSGLQKLMVGAEGGAEEVQAGAKSVIENIGVVLSSITDVIEPVITSILDNIGPVIATLAETIIEYAPTLIESGITLLESLINGLLSGENIPKLISAIISILGTLVTAITNNLPTVISAAIQIVIALAQGLTEAIPDLLPAITQLIVDLATMLTDPEMLTTLIETALELVIALAEGLVEAIPTLVEAIPTIIENLVNSIVELLPIIIQAGITLMEALFQGWIDALPIVLPSIIQAVLTISQTLTEPENLKLLLDAAILLLEAMIEGFTEAMPAIMSAIWQMLLNIINVIKSYFISMKANGQALIDKFKEGIQEKIIAVKQHIRDMMHNIHETIKEKIDAAKHWGRDLLQNFIDGITEKIYALKDKLSSVASTVKDYLGFSEPEKGPLSNFHTFAPDMIDLYSEGIYKSLPVLQKALNSMALTIEGAGTTTRNNNVTVNQYNSYASPHSEYELWQSKMNLQTTILDTVRGAV